MSIDRVLRLLAAPALLLALSGAAPTAELSLRLEGLRNDKGLVRICLARAAADFPKCTRSDAVTLSVPPARARALTLKLAPGEYGLAVLHDENSNGKLDTVLAIPREGFGFSRNPGIRAGAPRFEEVRFTVSGPMVQQRVAMKYLL